MGSQTQVEFISIEFNGTNHSVNITSEASFEVKSNTAVTGHLTLLSGKIQGSVDYELNSSSTGLQWLKVNGKRYSKFQCWTDEGFPVNFSGQTVPVLDQRLERKSVKWIVWN